MFGGTEAPAAYGELLSIGAIGGEKNKSVSPPTASQLGLPVCHKRKVLPVGPPLALIHPDAMTGLQISKLVADILETKLGIPSDRFYLTVIFPSVSDSPCLYTVLHCIVMFALCAWRHPLQFRSSLRAAFMSRTNSCINMLISNETMQCYAMLCLAAVS